MKRKQSDHGRYVGIIMKEKGITGSYVEDQGVNPDHILLELKQIFVHKSIIQGGKDGIIDSADVVMIDAMTKKERSLKKEYVLKKHVTSEGLPRLIKPPTGSIKGWSTLVEGKKRVSALTYDGLIDKLFDMYSDGYLNRSFENMFEAALQHKITFRSANTVVKYRADYKRYISDKLGKTCIMEITADFLSKYTAEMIRKKDLKKEAYRAFKGVLNLVFDFAISKGYIDYNPADRLNNLDFYRLCRPEFKSAEEKAMSPEQIEAITEEVRNRMNNPVKYSECYTCGYMFLLASYTGMRAGELCSLRWTDIANGRIHIHTQQLKNRETGRYEYVSWTKNEKGIPKGGRYFPVTSQIADLFSELKEAQKRAGIRSEWIFANQDGSWIITDTCYGKFLNRICKTLGYSITNNHAIRMYFNSYVLIPKGIQVTNRARLLGHSPEVNLKNYSFADYDYCETALAALDSDQVTPGDTRKIVKFELKNLRQTQ